MHFCINRFNIFKITLSLKKNYSILIPHLPISAHNGSHDRISLAYTQWESLQQIHREFKHNVHKSIIMICDGNVFDIVRKYIL